ncbi:MAG: hypothetical protein ABEJ47_02130 [Halorhabdus sp.]
MTDESSRNEQPEMTRGERVRAAARTLRTPRSAAWVAEETDVSAKTARKYLEQLVEDNVLRTVERDGHRLYCVDQLMATYREVATLQREHDREALTDALESIRSSIADWRESFDVETPGELRATIADIDDPDEIERRREIASEWEHLADRQPIVRAALTEYDWASDRDAVVA